MQQPISVWPERLLLVDECWTLRSRYCTATQYIHGSRSGSDHVGHRRLVFVDGYLPSAEASFPIAHLFASPIIFPLRPLEMPASPPYERQMNPSSQDGVKKRRKGATRLSCAECRRWVNLISLAYSTKGWLISQIIIRLKLRCDRQIPCSSCVKRGCGAICPDVSGSSCHILVVLSRTR
jgi:hypothetical protein